MKFATSLIIGAASLLAVAPVTFVEGHGKLVNPEGLNVQVNKGVALTSQKDVTRNRKGQPDTPCGRFNNGNGQELSLAGADLTPRMTVTPGQPAQLQWFQQNGDGAGPLVAEIDATGTGNNFKSVSIAKNIPGQNGRNKGTSRQALDLAVDIPQDLQCTGPNDACLIRLINPLGFVSCAPIAVEGAAGAQAGAAKNKNKGQLANGAAKNKNKNKTRRLRRRQADDDDEEELARRQVDDDEEEE